MCSVSQTELYYLSKHVEYYNKNKLLIYHKYKTQSIHPINLQITWFYFFLANSTRASQKPCYPMMPSAKAFPSRFEMQSLLNNGMLRSHRAASPPQVLYGCSCYHNAEGRKKGVISGFFFQILHRKLSKQTGSTTQVQSMMIISTVF